MQPMLNAKLTSQLRFSLDFSDLCSTARPPLPVPCRRYVRPRKPWPSKFPGFRCAVEVRNRLAELLPFVRHRQLRQHRPWRAPECTASVRLSPLRQFGECFITEIRSARQWNDSVWRFHTMLRYSLCKWFGWLLNVRRDGQTEQCRLLIDIFFFLCVCVFDSVCSRRWNNFVCVYFCVRQRSMFFCCLQIL